LDWGYATLLDALDGQAPLEIAFDCSGAADADATATVRSLIDDLPDRITLLILSRSRTEFEVGIHLESGTCRWWVGS